MDDEVWDHSTFTKNRDRLLGGEVAIDLVEALSGAHGETLGADQA